MTTLEDLKLDIDAFEACRESLEERHPGRYVVSHAAAFEGAHDSFHEAAQDAVERFGDAPFLIRQVGAERAITLPFALSPVSPDAGR